MTDTERADLAVRAANAGAQVALESFRKNVTVETKSGKTDFVTQTDRDAQRRVVEIIREESDEPIVGEEADALKQVPEDGSAWVVDPIDGTSNFVRGLRIWGTSVAVVRDGKPVVGATVLPALSDTYRAGAEGVTLNGDPVGVSDREDPETFAVAPILIEYDQSEKYATTVGALAERFGDLRRFGCSQATLAAVAGGSLEAAITNVEMSPWDTVAGVHMIRQAGGRVTNLTGDPWRHDSDGLVASNGVAHEEVLSATRTAEE
jgi:myo-inositol-1(or 4)-monophosphatase